MLKKIIELLFTLIYKYFFFEALRTIALVLILSVPELFISLCFYICNIFYATYAIVEHINLHNENDIHPSFYVVQFLIIYLMPRKRISSSQSRRICVVRITMRGTQDSEDSNFTKIRVQIRYRMSRNYHSATIFRTG